MQLEKIRGEIEAQDASLVAISVDAEDESVKLVGELGLHFRLLSDADLHVASLFGVAMEGQDIAVPAVFVVTREHAIVFRQVGENMTDRASPAEILARVRAARASQKP